MKFQLGSGIHHFILTYQIWKTQVKYLIYLLLGYNGTALFIWFYKTFEGASCWLCFKEDTICLFSKNFYKEDVIYLHYSPNDPVSVLQHKNQKTLIVLLKQGTSINKIRGFVKNLFTLKSLDIYKTKSEDLLKICLLWNLKIYIYITKSEDLLKIHLLGNHNTYIIYR